MGRDERLNLVERAALGAVDARGRTLQEGDEIILAAKGPIYFRIAGIVPVLDPTAPPGLMHVHVGCMATFVVKAGQINQEFVRVRTAEEAGPTSFKLLEATEQGKGEGGDGG